MIPLKGTAKYSNIKLMFKIYIDNMHLNNYTNPITYNFIYDITLHSQKTN